MKTLRLLVDANDPESRASRQAIARAAEILRLGGTVAFPTETVYGLGANAQSAEAVAKIFAAKQRPGWDPLIVHIDAVKMLREVVQEVPQNARRLMDVFWPGPLTILLPKRADIPDIVTAGLPRVGLRMPAHPVALALLRGAGVPVAAPSANTFGHVSPTRADHVAEDLDGRIDAILDGGETTHGVESTVVDVCEEGCVIYRPGVITLQQIRAVCVGKVTVRGTDEGAGDPVAGAASPGMAVRHYAPRARLILIEGEGEEQIAAYGKAARECEEAGEALGLMLPDTFQTAVIGRKARVFRWGKWSDEYELAQRLFAGLRGLDAGGATAIVCPVPAGKGIGLAIRDRLRKAGRR
ncbi:MAG TPA: L-threonylcarbamoyladenylate synthase [Acidobacteriaceae bacterium]|jgi:L-threonylcarbamoyladenylate synthase|nr:L-threonylcarbamoyladenylate synthase [Acidobacteriaceae bacterium]